MAHKALGLTSAVIAAAVVLSERASRLERTEKPINEASKTVLPYRSWKCAASKDVIVFVHGWPDDANIFADLAERLSKRFNCFSVNLPGYPLPPNFQGSRGNVPDRKWGFTVEECVIALNSTVANCRSEVEGCSSVTLITHDWGAIFGYLLDHKYPNVVQRMVSIDVGWRLNGPKPVGLLFTLGYQGFLNLAFLLPEAVGSALTNGLSNVLGRVPAASSGPVNSRMNWPYRAAWRDTFGKGFLTQMDQYKLTRIPRLFIYSGRTSPNLRFSDDAWYKVVDESVPGVSKCVAFDGNHWMMNTHPEEVAKLIRDWLDVSQSSTPVSRL